MQISTIGLDIAKSVFQAHVVGVTVTLYETLAANVMRA